MATRISKSSSKNDESSHGELAGKVAVITGAGRGIGKAIATVFARAGSQSILVVRDRESGERAAEELRKQGYKADVGIADITEPAQVSILALSLEQRYKHIDILVNNAGIFLRE